MADVFNSSVAGRLVSGLGTVVQVQIVHYYNE